MSVHGLCLEVLGVPEVELATPLAFASCELIRQRAPKLVTAAETLELETLTPVPGGLFDDKLFGPGTVIDAPPIADDEPVPPRKTQFARVRLALPIPHPLLAALPERLAELAGWKRSDIDRWLTGLTECELITALETRGHGDVVMRELPVLPPDLRPLRRLPDDRWAASPLTELYQRAIDRANRFAHVVDTGAPHVIIASERGQLQEALHQLFDRELRTLGGGHAGLAAALCALDRHPPHAALTGRLYRTESVLFALGFIRQA